MIGGGAAMARTADPSNPPCPRCGSAGTVRKGRSENRQRWVCAGCRRSFGATTGTAALAERVVQTTRHRTAQRAGIAWIGDDWEASSETSTAISCDPTPAAVHGWRVLRQTPGVGLTQAVKHRRGRRLTRVEVRTPLGPAVAQPSTVHIDRVDGVLRDRLACLTRKTHAFAKDAATWDAAVSLAIVERNWLRPHPALRQPLAVPEQGRRYRRQTPAMALGLTDHRWTWLSSSYTQFLTSQRGDYRHSAEGTSDYKEVLTGEPCRTDVDDRFRSFEQGGLEDCPETTLPGEWQRHGEQRDSPTVDNCLARFRRHDDVRCFVVWNLVDGYPSTLTSLVRERDGEDRTFRSPSGNQLMNSREAQFLGRQPCRCEDGELTRPLCCVE
jgi:hypothetical protein